MIFPFGERVPVLILGGGLAGLSAAYHLGPIRNLVVEKENEVGGTARSISIKGFTFDFTGHLLHLHTAYTKKLITTLLRGHFFECQRNTAIHSYNTTTLYPFQANTYGLPDFIIDECLLGFLETYLKQSQHKIDHQKLNFRDWCYNIFGEGISKHFMIPYNEKLFQTSTKSLTVDWCGPFVPRPLLEDVIRGALKPQEKKFGYNATFLYPKKGGIQALALALAHKIPQSQTNTEVEEINWKKKSARLSGGQTIQYEHLINTIPLPELLNRMADLPKGIKEQKKKLKFASILCLNLGVNRPRISERSWVYFPEKKYPFYRVGFPMNFTPHVVPKGCSSMYVEIPWAFVKGKSQKSILSAVRRGLIEARILKAHDTFRVAQFLPIKYAYVIYDRHRNIALDQIFSFLSNQDIQSIGRYGAWKYSFMEEAILDGKKAADNIPRPR